MILIDPIWLQMYMYTGHIIFSLGKCVHVHSKFICLLARAYSYLNPDPYSLESSLFVFQLCLFNDIMIVHFLYVVRNDGLQLVLCL